MYRLNTGSSLKCLFYDSSAFKNPEGNGVKTLTNKTIFLKWSGKRTGLKINEQAANIQRRSIEQDHFKNDKKVFDNWNMKK